jgi:hypothetical protein
MNTLSTTLLTLSLILTPLSTYPFPTPSAPFEQEDDMTAFDDLVAAGHQLRKKIKEEGERVHEQQVAELTSAYHALQATYVKTSELYKTERLAKWRLEYIQNQKISDMRCNCQWRDYIVMATGLGALASAVGMVAELVQHNAPATLGCVTLSAACLYAYGMSATWSENARFKAADELKEKYEKQNESLREHWETRATQKNEAEENLRQAYFKLQNIHPRTPQAQKLAGEVQLPAELIS